MNTNEQKKILDRIALLLNLTLDRGCMPGEIEVAAYKIGSLVQKYGLAVYFPGTEAPKEQPEREQSRRTYQRGAFAHVEVIVIGETEKAILCRSQEDEEEFWIPRSQCREGCERWGRRNSGTLYVSRWWAEKEGWT